MVLGDAPTGHGCCARQGAGAGGGARSMATEGATRHRWVGPGQWTKAGTVPVMAGHAAEALRTFGRFHHAAGAEHVLREKVLAPDFCCPAADNSRPRTRRLTLNGRHEGAWRWFADARRAEELDRQVSAP
jgi:hypothetical protein